MIHPLRRRKGRVRLLLGGKRLAVGTVERHSRVAAAAASLLVAEMRVGDLRGNKGLCL